MDKSYALQHSNFFISLIKAILLQGFDGKFTGSGPVTHFVYILFVFPGCIPQFTRLFITDIPQFFIVINLLWMRNKFTTIKLKPDVSIIVFEHFEQTEHTTETIIEPTKMNSFSQLNNYRPFTVEKKFDEKEPELPTINSKKKFLGQWSSQRKKVQTFNKRDEIPLFDEIIAPSIEAPQLPEIPFEIKTIAAVPFFHVSKQEGVELSSVSLKDVKKTFQPKHRNDLATKLPQKFHEFFELFSEKEINKLPPHRPYDHKINFIKRKQPGYGFLYSMSQGELQILKKKNSMKISPKASYEPARPQQLHRFCLFVNQVGVFASA